MKGLSYENILQRSFDWIGVRFELPPVLGTGGLGSGRRCADPRHDGLS
jgi:hypothetical protein